MYLEACLRFSEKLVAARIVQKERIIDKEKEAAEEKIMLAVGEQMELKNIQKQIKQLRSEIYKKSTNGKKND